ncbi:MAG: hypothetical protein FJ303_04490 [Planctomycetes bacterium]|nr:hypothetical protein [Planctomycetota bacterium]
MGWRDDDLNDDDDFNVRKPSAEAPQGQGALLGITSLVLGVISAVLWAGTLIVFFTRPGIAAGAANRDGLFIALAIAAVTIPGISFVGLVLGVLGAFSQDQRGWVCGIFGIVLNGIVMVSSIVLTCLGIGMVGFWCILCAALVGAANQQNRRAGQ